MTLFGFQLLSAIMSVVKIEKKVYFFYARFKPPSFDLRIENLIQPCLDILVVLLTTVLQGKHYYQFYYMHSVAA